MSELERGMHVLPERLRGGRRVTCVDCRFFDPRGRWCRRNNIQTDRQAPPCRHFKRVDESAPFQTSPGVERS
jgi:hypothetical protein